jgi:tRNA (cmo5U34)-methyltransferase
MPLEEMGDFFNARIDTYEDHMLGNVKYAVVYEEIAGLIPRTEGLRILDLGCGTGLELDAIFKANPTVRVTGIDLAEKMLAKLREKHADRVDQLDLVLADYLKYDFGIGSYDIALSVQTLHHLDRTTKIGLYRKIYAALKPKGIYIESDYVAPHQAFEDFHFTESQRLHAEQGIESGLFHYDTPFTLENQIAILQEAGFNGVKLISRHGNGATLTASK